MPFAKFFLNYELVEKSVHKMFICLYTFIYYHDIQLQGKYNLHSICDENITMRYVNTAKHFRKFVRKVMLTSEKRKRKLLLSHLWRHKENGLVLNFFKIDKLATKVEFI